MTLKGLCLLGASLAMGWLVLKWRPSSHMRSPIWYLGVSLCFIHRFWALTISSWACACGSLNCWSLRATCGIGDGLLIQSACRLYPINNSNGDFLVILWGHELYVNSAIGR